MPTTVYGRESSVRVLADGVRSRQEPVHPELPRDHDDRRAILFAQEKRAACDRRHAQNVEIVVRDNRGADTLRLIAEARHRHHQSAVGGERE